MRHVGCIKTLSSPRYTLEIWDLTRRAQQRLKRSLATTANLYLSGLHDGRLDSDTLNLKIHAMQKMRFETWMEGKTWKFFSFFLQKFLF